MKSLPKVQAPVLAQSGSPTHLECEYTSRTACGVTFRASLDHVPAAKWNAVAPEDRCLRCANTVDSIEALGLNGAVQALELARTARAVR